METAITAAISCIVTTVLGYAFGVLRVQLKKAKEREDEAKAKHEANVSMLRLHQEALLAILRDRIKQSCEHYIERGYATMSDRDVMGKSYKAYKSMGGNGSIDTLYGQFNELPFSL